jgi:hypothetical protein
MVVHSMTLSAIDQAEVDPFAHLTQKACTAEAVHSERPFGAAVLACVASATHAEGLASEAGRTDPSWVGPDRL